MTVRPVVCLKTPHDRRTAAHWCLTAPDTVTVEFRPAKRTDAQNRKLAPMARDIFRQHGSWFGPGLDERDVLHAFIAATFRDLRVARSPASDGGLVLLPRRSSELSVEEASLVIECMFAWAADPEHAVRWTDPAIIRENPREQAA